jgi:hypothetical protein
VKYINAIIIVHTKVTAVGQFTPYPSFIAGLELQKSLEFVHELLMEILPGNEL